MRSRVWRNLATCAGALILLADCSQPNILVPTYPASQATRDATSQSIIATQNEVAAVTATFEANPFAGNGPWIVDLTTEDGVHLAGTVYGHEGAGILLAPMYPGGQAGWKLFAEVAASKGYRVLTFDFRGYGDSDGTQNPTEALADLKVAQDFLLENSDGRIVLIGAGLGGTAVIRSAAQTADGSVLGIAVISAPRIFGEFDLSDDELQGLGLPSLWLGARNDMTQSTEELYSLAGGAKELWIYEGSSLHGTFIFEGADGSDLQQRLLTFISKMLVPK